MQLITEIHDTSAAPAMRGFLHPADRPDASALVLTHGAGANCESKLLVSVAETFSEAGFAVLRCDLPFRQKRPHGPPSPGSAEMDRRGLKRAVQLMREKTSGAVFLGGHSYGGRQASMLAAEEPDLVAGLLLLSYPLHPPRRPEQMRTAHFPRLRTPALFVHGSRDGFGSLDEFSSALQLIPGRHALMEIDGAGHELLSRKNQATLAADIQKEFQKFITAQ